MAKEYDNNISKIIAEVMASFEDNNRQILHCENCHHEWDSCLGTICDWCGGKGK